MKTLVIGGIGGAGRSMEQGVGQQETLEMGKLLKESGDKTWGIVDVPLGEASRAAANHSCRREHRWSKEVNKAL